MIRPREPLVESLSKPCPSFDVLLDQLTDEIQRNNDEAVEAFLRAHPDEESQLRQILPTMRAMAAISSAEPVMSPATDAEDASLAGEKPLGDFRLVREIGRGGMGVVYEADQLSLPRRVALKVLPFAAILDKRQLQRFQNEARAAATLDHPGIVSVYSVGCERGVHYYAMQLIEGQTLAQAISELRQRREVSEISGQEAGVRDQGSEVRGEPTEAHPGTAHEEAPVAVETVRVPHAAISTQRSTESVDFCRAVARLGVQAAEALDHAHTHGVLHRDIKPGNLMLDAEEKLRITDFGLARIQADPGMTVSGDILGTLRYMSPEQADGRFADERTDVYSLGVTLYELLTLQPPFQGERREELLKQIAWQEPPRLRQLNPAIPRELEIIIAKALAKEAGQRYSTAQEMAEDLRCFLENRPIHARPPTLADRAGKWLRRHPGLAVATLVASLLVMLVAGVSTAVVWQAKRDAENARARAEQEEAVAKQKREEIKAVVDFLVFDVLGSARADTGQAQKTTILEVLDNTERKLDQTLADQPLLEAAIRFRLGEVYGEMRMHDAELRQHTRAHQLYKQQAGLEGHNTLVSEMRIANVLRYKGKLTEAIDIYERILPIMRRVLTPSAGDTFACMSNLANALDEAGSFPAARKLREEALEWCRVHRTADHRDTTEAMANLALSLSHTGDVTAAHDLLQETLQTQQRVLGPEDPLARQTLRSLAKAQVELGESATARELSEQLLEICERVQGPEHPDTIAAMSDLAYFLKPAAARELLERAVEASQRVLGPEHRDTLALMANLGQTQINSGDFATARALLDQVVERVQRVLGPEHPNTLIAMHMLAASQLEMGDYRAARKLTEQLVEKYQRALGPEHPETLNAMSKLALVQMEMGDLAAARKMTEQLVEVRRRVLGPEHRDTLNSMNHLGSVLSDMKENATARELREQVFEISQRVLGPEDLLTLQAMNNLAGIQLRMGEHAAARDMFEQVRDAWQRVLGPEHRFTLMAMGNLSLVLREMGDLTAARKLGEQVLEIQRRVLGPEHPDTLKAMNDLATSLSEVVPAAARELREQVLEIRRRVLGPEHPDTLDAMNDLANSLSGEEPAAARALREQVLEIRQRVLGPEHSDTLSALNNLAASLEEMGEYAAARDMWERVLDKSQRVVGPEDPDTLNVMINLGVVLGEMGEYATARELEEQVLEITQRDFRPDHPTTLHAMNNLACTLAEMGESAAARELREQVLEIRQRVLGPASTNIL